VAKVDGVAAGGILLGLALTWKRLPSIVVLLMIEIGTAVTGIVVPGQLRLLSYQ